MDDAISLAQVPEAQVSHMNRWLRLPGHLLHPPTPHNNGLSGLSVGRRVKKEDADAVHRLLCKYAGTTQTWNAMQNSFPRCARKAEVKGFPQKPTCLGGEKARGPGSTAVQGQQLSDGLGKGLVDELLRMRRGVRGGVAHAHTHQRPLVSRRQGASLVHAVCSLSPATLWHYPALALLSLCIVAVAASGAGAARVSSETLGLPISLLCHSWHVGFRPHAYCLMAPKRPLLFRTSSLH